MVMVDDVVLCQNSALLKDHGCNLMHRKVLASFYQHLMAEAPVVGRCCTALAESKMRLLWWPRYVRP